MRKVSVLQACRFQTYLSFALKIDSKKTKKQHSCLHGIVALQKPLFLTVFSKLAVVSVRFFTVAHYKTSSLTLVMLWNRNASIFVSQEAFISLFFLQMYFKRFKPFKYFKIQMLQK